SPVQFLNTIRDLRIVQQEVSKIAGTRDVSVNLQNGRLLNIAIGNSDGSGAAVVEPQDLPQRAARAAYLAYVFRSQVQAVAVRLVPRRTWLHLITSTVMTDSQLFRPIQLIESSDSTEHWVKPPEISNRLYLVAVGSVQPDLIKELGTHFRRTLGIIVEELP